MNPSVITIIPSVLSAIAELTKLYHETMRAAKQNAELTTEQEAAFQQRWEAIRSKPEWQPSHIKPN